MTGAKLLGGMFIIMGAGLIVLGLVTNDAVFAGCGGTMAAASIPCFLDKPRRGTCTKRRRGPASDDEAAMLATAAPVATVATSTN
jgi:hypothetical protein